MILYFSGTGNSEYAAKRIAAELQDEAVNLFHKIRRNDCSKINSETPWVIVTPTYGWRIPRILQEWLSKTELKGAKDIYFVMTCGGSIGNAGKYVRKLCSKKGLSFKGCIPVVMPENYIALFSTPTEEQAMEIIERAEVVIDKVASYIRNGEEFPQAKISIGDRMSSGIINDLFYPLFVHAKKFYVTNTCISCGKCLDVCPTNNIRMENKKPVWAENCTHCMACINRCPKEAIEYGKHSHGLPRYTCKKEMLY